MGLYIPWLADAARTTGYRVVEVGGWRTRGHGPMRLVEGVVTHHTATSASAPGDYPSLNIVTFGRSDLPGPLAQLGLGRDGTIYVMAAGLSYHAGASRWAGFLDLNDEFVGIEAESPGDGTWTAAQRDCYPKLVAALLRYMNRDADRMAGHKDVCVPVGRKPDPRGIDTAVMRGQVRQYLTGGIPSGGGGESGGGAPADDTLLLTLAEDSMIELGDTTGLPSGIDTISGPVPGPGSKLNLVVNAAWQPIYVHEIKFVGPSPASGIAWVGEFAYPGQIDPGRPLRHPVPDGAVGFELTYGNGANVDLDPETGRHNTPHAGFQVRG